MASRVFLIIFMNFCASRNVEVQTMKLAISW